MSRTTTLTAARCHAIQRAIRRALPAERLEHCIGLPEWYLYLAARQLHPAYTNVTAGILAGLTVIAHQRLQSVSAIPETMSAALCLLKQYLDHSQAYRRAQGMPAVPIGRRA